MDIVECIKTRRSIRKFLPKTVPEDYINKILDSARYAPFGGPPKKDCQVWDFIIIRNPEIKEKLALEFQDRQFIKTAPVIIAVCADKTKDAKYKDWEISASLSIENILLSANSLGLGACYVDTFIRHEDHKNDKIKLREILEIPEHIELIAIIPIGYPDPSEKLKEKELREVKEIIHLEKW
jgi:nitroreductase